ncbi:hypothetical protein SUGI_1174240 [Cryptomeria japonica]|nr:hypothetical protein SUGI_1174240 [Cryptomeria japonica]
MIPSALANCLALEYLNLSNNAFEGPIPDALGKLKNLESVDLSFNFLSGTIPTSLTNMKVLRYFSACFNNLTGEDPKVGLFSNNTFNESSMGNNGLCGGENLPEHACPNQGKKLKSPLTKTMLSAAGVIAFLLCISIFGILCCRKYSSSQFDLPDFMFGRLRYPRLTYQELVNATNRFNETNLFGVGSFGSVFKGILRDGMLVAIKVLNFQNEELENSFKRECIILARTRHRNLVRVISAYSDLNFKALILQFATNGSLEKLLYPESNEDGCEVNIDECLNIAIDVAHGMEYLHHDCPIQVIHCDLKPSNVLLDANMTALVADFGISRLAGPTNLIDSLSTSIAMRGSIGYIAPEYGLGINTSTKGDVYSYGILIIRDDHKEKAN